MSYFDVFCLNNLNFILERIETTQYTNSTMAGFFDSDKFMFVVQEDGFLAPIHYRELGEKEGHLYSKKVSWVDATINNVSLEQTFQYENEIEQVTNISNVTNGYIIVNERQTSHINMEIDHTHIQKKWLNRLDKLTLQPMTLPQAKKKKNGPQRFPVKPKTDIQKDTEHHSSEKFQELIDTKSTGILGEYIYTIDCFDGYEKNVTWDDGDWRGDNVKKQVRYIPKYKKKTYCPPEHWLTPVVLWKNIWAEMDTIERGYKRDYVYIPDGEACPDSSSIGPAIWFFKNVNTNIEEYEKEWNRVNDKYWITGSNRNRCSKDYGDCEMGDISRLSDTSYLLRVEKKYLENPNKETYQNYYSGWLLTHPGYMSYYQSYYQPSPVSPPSAPAPSHRRRPDGICRWKFIVSAMHNTRPFEYIECPPQPHL